MRRSIRILLVDDDQDILDVIGLMLDMDGAEVSYATNYHEALDLVEKEEFDIVITDWRMPKMHGLYLLDMIKDSHPDMPVIIMSAFFSEESREKALRRKADMLIAKPFEYRELHAGIIKLAKKNNG